MEGAGTAAAVCAGTVAAWRAMKTPKATVSMSAAASVRGSRRGKTQAAKALAILRMVNN
jgi:hypothetical protein